jgi:xylulokinase
MRVKPLLLGIDLGTTNIKALLVEYGGKTVAEGAAAVTVRHLADGGAEQDIGEIWKATCAAISQAVSGANGAPVSAIGISSQGGAMQLLDPSDRPVGPVIGWQDSRAKPWNEALTAERGTEWFARRSGWAGCGGAIGQLLRLREAGAFTSGTRLGFVGDVIVGMLCGRRGHDATSLSEPCLLNPSTGDADDEVLALLGLDRSRMPVLLGPDVPAGGLLPDVARSLGLSPGIPVGPAVHDQYAAALGSGAVHAGRSMLGTGTAWVIVAVTDHLAPPMGGIALVGRHPVPGLYGQMLSMANGGSCLSWVMKTFGLGEPRVREVDALLASVPPGSDGLRFRPLLSEGGGHGLPPSTAGRLDGLRLRHTAAHVVRAAVEGLACELTRYLGMMTENGVAVDSLVLCGRTASSGVTPSLIADATGLPVDCVSATETSALGAAVLARALAEPGTGLAALSDAMKPDTRTVLPGPGREQARRMAEEYRESFNPRGPSCGH